MYFVLGCASLLVIESDNSYHNHIMKADTSAEIGLSVDESYLKLNSSSVCPSTAAQKHLNVLLTSFHQLEREHGLLTSAYEELKKSYHLQKQMTWHWRKKATVNDYVNNVPKIDDGLMKVGVTFEGGYDSNIENFTAAVRRKTGINTTKNIISNLQDQLQKEKELAKLWKGKYCSVKLAKIRKCAKLGKSMAAPFSFSGCLTLFSSVLPDFNITTKLNFSKRVETITDHVHSAWSILKNKWKSNVISTGSASARRKVSRFRKMLSNGIMINSKNLREPTDEVYNEYDADEHFKTFKKRRKIGKQINFLKPEQKESRKVKKVFNLDFTKPSFRSQSGKKANMMNDKTRRDSEAGCSKNEVMSCNIREFYHVLMGNKGRLRQGSTNTEESTFYLEKNKVRNDIENNANKDIDDNVEKEEIEYKNMKNYFDDTKYITELNDKQVWYKKRFDELKFNFDVYKWKTDAKMDKIISEMDRKFSFLEKEKYALKKTEKKLTSKVKLIKEKLVNEQNKLNKAKVKAGEYQKKFEDRRKTVEQSRLNDTFENSIDPDEAKKRLDNKNKIKARENERLKKQIFHRDPLRKADNVIGKNEPLINTVLENKLREWRIPLVYCLDQKICKPSLSSLVSNKTISSVNIEPVELYQNNVPVVQTSKPALLHASQYKTVYGVFPGKPMPPKRSMPPNCLSPTLPKKLMPAPPKVPREPPAAKPLDSSEGNDKAMPLSWYLYWGKARTLNGKQMCNQVFSEIPVDWYLTWMQSRDKYRKMHSGDENELNWYLKIMKSREEQRSIDVPMSWYSKWIKGRNH